MGKTRTLASTVSTGGVLADGAIAISEVSGLQAALDGKGLTSGTASTTSGLAAYEFANIPALAKNIRLLFRNVSTSADASIQVQLGTAGGQVTSGYDGTVLTVNSATASHAGTVASAFFVTTASGSNTLAFNGVVELSEIEPNVWIENGHLAAQGTRTHLSACQVSLGAELTTIKLLVASGTFDGGTINILYE